jgi:hypothetical protein
LPLHHLHPFSPPSLQLSKDSFSFLLRLSSNLNAISIGSSFPVRAQVYQLGIYPEFAPLRQRLDENWTVRSERQVESAVLQHLLGSSFQSQHLQPLVYGSPQIVRDPERFEASSEPVCRWRLVLFSLSLAEVPFSERTEPPRMTIRSRQTRLASRPGCTSEGRNFCNAPKARGIDRGQGRGDGETSEGG